MYKKLFLRSALSCELLQQTLDLLSLGFLSERERECGRILLWTSSYQVKAAWSSHGCHNYPIISHFDIDPTTCRGKSLLSATVFHFHCSNTRLYIVIKDQWDHLQKHFPAHKRPSWVWSCLNDLRRALTDTPRKKFLVQLAIEQLKLVVVSGNRRIWMLN